MDELSLTMDVRLNSAVDGMGMPTDPAIPGSLEANLFFLQMVMTDKFVNGSYSHFTGGFSIDLTEPGSTSPGRLTVPEITSASSFSDLAQWGLGFEADVNFDITIKIEGASVLPEIQAEFELDWILDVADPSNDVLGLAFNNVQLDLGSFFSEFLSPVLTEIQTVTMPLEPVIDILTQRLPVISDIMGEDFDLIDVGLWILDLTNTGTIKREFIDAFIAIIELVNTTVPNDTGIMIDLGSFDLSNGNLMQAGGLDGVDPNVTMTAPDAETQLAGMDSSEADSNSSFISKLKGVDGFSVPLLTSPTDVFKLIMGQDISLVEWRPPALEIDFSIDEEFPIFWPLYGSIDGSLNAKIDFAIGYDTSGLRQFYESGFTAPEKIFNGFFISDFDENDVDIDEVSLSGHLTIGGSVDAGIFRGGISGSLAFNASVDLNDVNNDGKLRLSEIVELIAHQDNPLDLFDFDAMITVGAYAYVDSWGPTGWAEGCEDTFLGEICIPYPTFGYGNIFSTNFGGPYTLLNIHHEGVDLASLTPVLGRVDASTGEFTLHSGKYAGDRLYQNTVDGAEHFEISHVGGTLGNETILVKYFLDGPADTEADFEIEYSGVASITVFGGAMGDRIVIQDGVLSDATLHGEGGKDYLKGGSGTNYLFGDAGIDTLIGGLGADFLDGGSGADTLTGGLGLNTYLFAGGFGLDTLNGTAGAIEVLDFGALTDPITVDLSASEARHTALDKVTIVGPVHRILGTSADGDRLVGPQLRTQRLEHRSRRRRHRQRYRVRELREPGRWRRCRGHLRVRRWHRPDGFAQRQGRERHARPLGRHRQHGLEHHGCGVWKRCRTLRIRRYRGLVLGLRR